MYTLFIITYYTLYIYYITYSSHIHYSMNYFDRSKTKRMLIFLLILLDSKLHLFATNSGEKNAEEEKRCFEIATVLDKKK